MARLNIEESFWDDPRLSRLSEKTGSRISAIGLVVTFWRRAQLEYINDRGLIPLKKFYDLGFTDDLVETGWAEKREGGIYAHGSEEHFKWIISCREKGRKGGLASAKMKLENQAPAKPTQAKGTQKSNPLTLTLPLAPSLVQKKEELNLTKTATPTEPATPVGRLRDLFLSEFEKRWKREYPTWGAKENGQMARLLKSISEDRLGPLIRAYIRWNDPMVVRAGHAFGLLVTGIPRLEAALYSPIETGRAIGAGKAFEKMIEESTRMDAEMEALSHVREIERTNGVGVGGGSGKEVQGTAVDDFFRKHSKLS